MLTPFIFIFSLFLLISSVISISSSTWLGAWLGLEVNLMSFIPLVMALDKRNSEGLLKYFLVQVFSSVLFLMSVISVLYSSGLMYFEMSSLVTIIVIPLMIKLGSAPFHFWFPAVASNLDWVSNFILMTWQKLVPLVLLIYMLNFNMFSIIVIIMSSVIGSVGGLNQTSLRKLMAYSSINHLSWLVVSCVLSSALMMNYFVIYSITNFIILFMFYKLNLFFLSQLSYLNTSFLNMMLFINMFSFGGLPPFMGFMPKWFLLDSMLTNSMQVLSLIMVMFGLLSLYYYMRLGYVVYSQSGLINAVSNYKPEVNLLMIIMSCFSLLGLILLPLMLALI